MAAHLLLHGESVHEGLLGPLMLALSRGHIAQHTIRVEGPAVVGADHTVVAVHLVHPAQVQGGAPVGAHIV